MIEPAAMATEIWGKGREHLSRVRSSLTPEQQEVYGEALAAFDETLASSDEDAESPDEVVTALTASSPNERYLVGRGARSLMLLQPILPTALFDRVKQRVAGSS